MRNTKLLLVLAVASLGTRAFVICRRGDVRKPGLAVAAEHHHHSGANNSRWRLHGRQWPDLPQPADLD